MYYSDVALSPPFVKMRIQHFTEEEAEEVNTFPVLSLKVSPLVTKA